MGELDWKVTWSCKEHLYRRWRRHLKIHWSLLWFPETKSSSERLGILLRFFFWCTIVDVEFWIRPADHMVQCSEFSFFNLHFWRCISDAHLCTKEFLYVICFWKLLQVTFVLRRSLALPCWFWKLSAFSSNFKCPENLSILFIQERKIKNENIFYAKSK